MRIGLVGVGYIGATLAQKLKAAGNDVLIANSRSPDTIADIARASGATASWAGEAVRDADVVILSVPLENMDRLAPLVAEMPAGIPLLDTSNYYPQRGGAIAELDAGQLESEWVAEKIGRPVTKAWNAVLAGTLKTKGRPAGEAGRLAIPYAGDDPASGRIAATLIDQTGFDAVDAGSIAESWRIQTGQPTYCTELTARELEDALPLADRALGATRRDIGMAAIGTFGGTFDNEDILHVLRAIMRYPR